MKPTERTEAVRAKAEKELPSLLENAGLPNFAEYLKKPPLRADDNEFTVYIANQKNDTRQGLFFILIQVQLHGQNKGQEYHDVIWPWILEKVQPGLVGLQDREEVEADLWPMGPNTQNVFNYYEVAFSEDLDDCDY